MTIYRMYFRSLTRSETEKEKLLLAHQVNDETISGRFPLNCDLAREMSALMAQVRPCFEVFPFMLLHVLVCRCHSTGFAQGWGGQLHCATKNRVIWVVKTCTAIQKYIT